MRIVVCGACGKMGGATASLALERGHTVFGFDRVTGDTPFPLFSELGSLPPSDVLIDVSSPEGLKERLGFCVGRGLPCVIGVTGLGGDGRIRESAESIPVFLSENFSVGIALLQTLARRAATVLKGFDVEIIERHHREKQDAPSGTALALAKNIRSSLPTDPEILTGRNGKRGDEIGIHAVRGGSIVGEHEVLFAGTGERMSLIHTAEHRGVFAAGALRAAEWLTGKKSGLYGMDDLIGNDWITRIFGTK